MSKRFVLVTSELADEGESAIAEYFNEAGAGWWHHIPRSWLVVDNEGKLTVSKIRNKLLEKLGNSKCIVVEVSDRAPWAGRINPNEIKSSEEWFKSSWGRSK